MAKGKTRLQEAREKAENTIKGTNNRISALGEHAKGLFEMLNEIQGLFDAIRNIPNDQKLQYKELTEIRLNWRQQSEKIEADFENAMAQNAGKGVIGLGAGVAVVALGPAAAMGVATTFGVASTGTAISALSGAAATNAALAWLGGGALAAGGGGMVAGQALIALSGPIGWAIAGVAALSSGIMLWKTSSERKRLEDIFTLISKRDIKSYELAIVELDERIVRIKEETLLLAKAIDAIQTFGTDYEKMTEEQQFQLGAYVNLMEASTRLLVNPILGLLPKYTDRDLKKFMDDENVYIEAYKWGAIVSLANLLYKIKLEEKDKKLLIKSLKHNKEFLATSFIEKKDMDLQFLNFISVCLAYKYDHM